MQPIPYKNHRTMQERRTRRRRWRRMKRSGKISQYDITNLFPSFTHGPYLTTNPATLLQLRGFQYSGKTQRALPLFSSGFLRSVEIRVTKSVAGKLTPKQRRRALHKRNRREAHAWKYDAPFNRIETIELEGE